MYNDTNDLPYWSGSTTDDLGVKGQRWCAPPIRGHPWAHIFTLLLIVI